MAYDKIQQRQPIFGGLILAGNKGFVIKYLVKNSREIQVFPVAVSLAVAGVIVALVAVFLIGGSGNASTHSGRGLPYLAGVNYFDSGKYEQAVGELSNAIHLNNTDLDAYFFRGLAYDKLGQHRRAIKDFDKIIELDAGNNFAYVNRGVVYGKLGRHWKAIQDLDTAIELDPGYSFAYSNRSITHSELGQHTKAAADKVKACALNGQLC